MPDRTSSEVSFRVSSRKRVQGKWIPHVKVCVGSPEKGKYKTRVSSSMNRTVGRKIIGRHVVTGESLRESFFTKNKKADSELFLSLQDYILYPKCTEQSTFLFVKHLHERLPCLASESETLIWSLILLLFTSLFIIVLSSCLDFLERKICKPCNLLWLEIRCSLSIFKAFLLFFLNLFFPVVIVLAENESFIL